MASGDFIQAAMVGRDGMVGAAAGWKGQVALNQAAVQVDGVAAAIDAAEFQKIVQRSPTLGAVLMRHEQTIIAEAQQSAACNVTHRLEARLARWLLRCHELAERDEFSATQEDLARILGVRRTSLSLVASVLQQSGAIGYRRGHIKIKDPDALRSAACECHATIAAITSRRHLLSHAESMTG
jgi:hypothetical protein